MVAFPISLLPLSFPNVHPGWGGIFGKTKLGDRDIVGNTDLSHFTFFKKKFTYLFLDRGEGREKESERNINMWLPLERLLLGTWPAAQECALTGNQTGDPLVCRLALSPLSHTSQGWIQGTFLMYIYILVEYIPLKRLYNYVLMVIIIKHFFLSSWNWPIHYILYKTLFIIHSDSVMLPSLLSSSWHEESER